MSDCLRKQRVLTWFFYWNRFVPAPVALLQTCTCFERLQAFHKNPKRYLFSIVLLLWMVLWLAMLGKNKAMNLEKFCSGWRNNRFDPLNISSYLDLRWLRESEIKHCRIASMFSSYLVRISYIDGCLVCSVGSSGLVHTRSLSSSK